MGIKRGELRRVLDLEGEPVFEIPALMLDHAVRGGIDSEEFTSTFEASTYAGGVYYRYFPAPAPGGTTNGVPNDQNGIGALEPDGDDDQFMIRTQFQLLI